MNKWTTLQQNLDGNSHNRGFKTIYGQGQNFKSYVRMYFYDLLFGLTLRIMIINGVLVNLTIIMCLASIPGVLEPKDITKSYSRDELFKIGKAYKHNPTKIISGQSAVFTNIQNLSLQKRRVLRKRTITTKIAKKHKKNKC